MNNGFVFVLAFALGLGVAHESQAKKPAPAKAAKAAPAAPKEVAVDVPPPSGNWEPKAPAAEGYVWSGGYYQWKDGHYEWKAGEWVLAKEGMDYRQHKWQQRADGKWILTGGDWVPHGESVAGSSKP